MLPEGGLMLQRKMGVAMSKLKDLFGILKGVLVFIGGVIALILIKRNSEEEEKIVDELDDENSKLEEENGILIQDIESVEDDITEIKEEIDQLEEELEDTRVEPKNTEDLDNFFDDRGF